MSLAPGVVCEDEEVFVMLISCPVVVKGQLPGVPKQSSLFMDNLGHAQKPLRDMASYSESIPRLRFILQLFLLTLSFSSVAWSAVRRLTHWVESSGRGYSSGTGGGAAEVGVGYVEGGTVEWSRRLIWSQRLSARL